MVRSLEVRHLKCEVLRAVIGLCAKDDRQNNSANRIGPFARDNVVEGLFTGLEPLEVEVHALQDLGEDDDKTAATINQHLGE